jgi:hypothetical protein
MASKIKVDQIQTGDGTGTIALQNQLSGMTSASMPTGSVLQVLRDNHFHSSTHYSTTSTSFIDTELSITITPSSASSMIMITVFLGLQSSATTTQDRYRVVRDTTALVGEHWVDGLWVTTGGVWDDLPNTTSAVTYKVQYKSGAGDTGYYHHANVKSSLTVMEIKV